MSDPCRLCKLTLAGPGAGKTTKMIDAVESCISNLDSNRHIAVITYTNEATKEIQSKLKGRIEIPNNLFIGTIHSFLIKFIFEPYAHIFDITNVDKFYIDKIELNPEHKESLYNKYKYNAAKAIEKNTTIKRAEEVLGSGFVIYDQILEKAHSLILNEKIRSIVANRLQYIFVDEYQDSRFYQHDILMKIFLEEKTSIYAIGDPMQSIFYFSYGTSQLKNEPIPKSYDQLPINALKNLCNEKEGTNEGFSCLISEENYRSRPNIVTFINNFNIIFHQKSVRKDNCVPVVFINEINIERLIETFLNLKEKYNIRDEADEVNCRINSLFLSWKWNCFEEVGQKFEISRISNDDCNSNLLFRETLRCILGMIGKSKKQLNADFGINEIMLRKFVFKVLNDILSDTHLLKDISTIQSNIIQEFVEEFDIDRTELKINQSLCFTESLKKILGNSVPQSCNEYYYSTIHSAKGLEAGSVLIIAENKKLLNKWLSTNENDFKRHDGDNYRLGFVGFSRARNFLCIGCLENIFPDFENRLSNLNVLIEPPLNKPQKTFDDFF